MNKIVKIAIVMAIMMSATFAFGQGTGTNNPNGGTTVVMIIEKPTIDTEKYDITHRWKDNAGNWSPWEAIQRDATGWYTELYIWTPFVVTKYEYQIAAKKQDGTPIAGTVGIFTINGTILYPHGWLRANP